MPMPKALRVTLGQHSLAKAGAVNQDFHGAMLPEGALRMSKGIVVALADGIGSSRVSQVASAAAVRGFLDDYYATSDAWSVRRAAQRVLSATNSWLHAQTMRSDARFDKDSGYVCTFSALILKGRDVHMLHVGDARIYRLHPHALEQLTEDHRVHLSSVESYLGPRAGRGPERGDRLPLLGGGSARSTCWPPTAPMPTSTPPRCTTRSRAAATTSTPPHGCSRSAARARGSDDDCTVQLLRIDELPAADAAPLHAAARRPRHRAAARTPRALRGLHAGARTPCELAQPRAPGRGRCDRPAGGAQAALGRPARRPEYLDSFVLEEWVARRVDSVHVLKASAIERARGHLYVAMEYVDGQTLAQWMVDHPRPSLDSVRASSTQLASGLQALHGKEMLHQDVRPENVMIDRTGTVRSSTSRRPMWRAWPMGRARARPLAIAGTLQYTAPEYFTGQGGSARSDLFSLAVIAYQMLTGQLPYGLHVSRVRSPADVNRLRYVPARHLRPDLPSWVDAVLQKALNPNPAKRQEAVSELAHDLRHRGRSFCAHACRR
jgi:hypothetical protein